jgi:hypothetical protein
MGPLSAAPIVVVRCLDIHRASDCSARRVAVRQRRVPDAWRAVVDACSTKLSQCLLSHSCQHLMSHSRDRLRLAITIHGHQGSPPPACPPAGRALYVAAIGVHCSSKCRSTSKLQHGLLTSTSHLGQRTHRLLQTRCECALGLNPDVRARLASRQSAQCIGLSGEEAKQVRSSDQGRLRSAAGE